MGQAVRSNPWHLGLALMLAWPFVMVHVLLVQVGPFSVAVFYATMSLTMVLVLAMESEKPLGSRSKTNANVLACLFVGLSCVPSFFGMDGLPVYVAAAMCGTATALGYIDWAQPYSVPNTEDRITLGWASLVLCVPFTLFSLAPAHVATMAAALLCVASYFCAHKAGVGHSPLTENLPHRTLKDNVRSAIPLWHTAVGVVVYSFAVGVSWPLLLDNPPNYLLVSALSFIFFVALIGVGMLLISKAFNFKLNFSYPWRIVVLVLSAAILIAPQVDGAASDVAVSLVRTTEIAITALWFMCLSSISNTNRLDPGHVLGFGWLFFSLPCALGVVFGQALLTINPLTTILPACTVLALVAVAFFVGDEPTVTETGGARQEEAATTSPDATETQTSPISEADPVSARCAAVALECGLTNREAEIFDLLAHGRSGVHIAETLNLSENTVKGHTKRLYTILGVHSRQELIDRANSVSL